MEATGTNATQLIRLLAQKGCSVSKGTMSSILSKSRRCSLGTALALHEVTGVPIPNMVEWPPASPATVRRPRTSRVDAEESRA